MRRLRQKSTRSYRAVTTQYAPAASHSNTTTAITHARSFLIRRVTIRSTMAHPQLGGRGFAGRYNRPPAVLAGTLYVLSLLGVVVAAQQPLRRHAVSVNIEFVVRNPTQIIARIRQPVAVVGHIAPGDVARLLDVIRNLRLHRLR